MNASDPAFNSGCQDQVKALIDQIAYQRGDSR